MKLKTMIHLIKQKKLFLSLKLGKAFEPFYRLCYASSAASSGFLDVFSKGSVTFDDIHSEFANDSNSKDMLTSWLQLGVRLKEIKINRQRYEPAGFSKKLRLLEYDAYKAIVQEVVTAHPQLIEKAPEMIQNNNRWMFADHDGSLVARSSRTLEPFVLETIESFYPSSRPVNLLEVGCGSAIYLKYAALSNPNLNATGLELQNDVAELATDNIIKWGLNDRVTVRLEDIRKYDGEEKFDIVSLHNNIYYFDVNERVNLFKKINKLLNPGGFIVLTTACQGGSPIAEVLNLWSVTTNGCDRLPSVNELKTQLKDAGYTSVKSKQLIPGEQYHAFIGFK